jgi:hypothetical protein
MHWKIMILLSVSGKFLENNSDRMLNASLNRIKDILGKAKIDAN